MRISQLRRQTVVPSFFASSKCKIAIPLRNVLLRDALQQASLESSVRAISYRKATHLQGSPVALIGVVIERVDGNFLLAVCETRPKRSDEELSRLAEALESSGLRLLERDAHDIRREPLFSNARTVWSYERYHVPLKDRLKIAAALSEDGPQSIIELEERARPTCDILAAVCALACEDLVRLNIDDAPLSPSTIVLGG
ncbi:hypothetical protein HNQ36_003934 [Afipia massiliensis]|uniref:Uncharacterized protein n=1 Tax=Afipia massiliensis TaxID=211460 RepID=A0A840N5Q3_9BRAD|nr:hypothetical protein [Afipia massiliensis]MBB5053934.1 hypothetical protein [Afipia massiliensis]